MQSIVPLNTGKSGELFGVNKLIGCTPLGRAFLKWKDSARVLEDLNSQIAMRPATSTEWERQGARKAALAQVIAASVRELFHWPNDHFIPQDSFDLMCFDDDGAGVEVVNRILEFLGLPENDISNDQIAHLRTKTFVEVVEFFLEYNGTQSNGKCDK